MNINDLAVKVEALRVRMENIEEISRDAKKDRSEMLSRQERIEEKLDTRVSAIESKLTWQRGYVAALALVGSLLGGLIVRFIKF